MSKIFEAVRSTLLDNIAQLDRPYACDLHTRLYKDQSAGIYTPLSMVVSIMGWELLDAIYGDTRYFYDGKWNEQLSDDDLAAMLTLAEEWFAENPDGLQEIWESLDIS